MRIERFWNREFLRQWMIIASISLILQMFFQSIREIRLLNDSYQWPHMTLYLFRESFLFLMEFLPITLFISAIALQDEWKRKNYYLSALLDGVTSNRWRWLCMKNFLLLLTLWIPLWFVILPIWQLSGTQARLTRLDKMPHIEENKIYLLSDNKMAYVVANQKEHLIDLESYQPIEINATVDQWKQQFTDFQIGIDKQPLSKKTSYWKQVNGKEKLLLTSSFMKDVMYLLSLALCWIYISIDREHKMFLSPRDSTGPFWSRRVFHTILLYWGIKIMPLLARFFAPVALISGYAAIVTLSLFI